MTKQEALQSLIDFELPAMLIEKALIDKDINGQDDYSASNKKEIDLCFVELLNSIITKADIKEGDLNITIDRAKMIRRRDEILDSYGLLDSGTINDASELW